jgi:hypothetical protein
MNKKVFHTYIFNNHNSLPDTPEDYPTLHDTSPDLWILSTAGHCAKWCCVWHNRHHYDIHVFISISLCWRGNYLYCHCLEYIASNGNMIIEWWFWKNLEGRSRDLIKVLHWHLPGGTEKNHKKPFRLTSIPSKIWTCQIQIWSFIVRPTWLGCLCILETLWQNYLPQSVTTC